MAESEHGSPEESVSPPAPESSATPEFTSRRARRAAEAEAAKHSRTRDIVVRRDTRPEVVRHNTRPEKAKSSLARPQAAPSRDVRPPAGPTPHGSAKKKAKRGILNLIVMTFAAGIVATMALPAYAFNPNSEAAGRFGTSAIDGMKKAHSQKFTVDGAVAETVVKHDAVSATTEEELAAKKAAEQAEAERQRIAEQFQAYQASYSGPSVSDMLANPPNPNFSLPAVFATAKQYIGTPYVYGGATPAGFDCSGYTMYVYAQFGIALPHSVSGQAAMGTRISMADAQPGDLVVMSGIGHIGFYAGNGNIMDAPDVGRSISIRPIWTDNFTIVRIGI